MKFVQNGVFQTCIVESQVPSNNSAMYGIQREFNVYHMEDDGKSSTFLIFLYEHQFFPDIPLWF